MASLLVIGGSGFFGKSILDAYKKGLLNHWEIEHIHIVARNASNLIKRNPELIAENIFLHNLDITKCNELPVADYVIHAAASTDANNYLSKSQEEKINIQLGTLNFCELAKRQLSKSKIVYVSSGAAYGKQPDDLSHISENFDFQPISSLEKIKQEYASAKRDSENYIKNLGGEEISVSIARCFSFVGRHLQRDKHFAIGNFIEDGLQGRIINVKTKYQVYRSYLYADDLVKWLMTIANQSKPQCPIVNVGSDESILIGDLAKKIGAHFGLMVHIPELISQNIDRYVPAIEKAQSMGCRVNINIDNSIIETIKEIKLHYSNNIKKIK